MSLTGYSSFHTFPVFHERRWVFLLCGLAAVHVFIYSAAFPFFNNVDEDSHFDLVVKYSQGDIPKKMDPYCEQALPFLVYYGTMEYLPLQLMPRGVYPAPPWTLPAEQAVPQLQAMKESGRQIKNHESSQAPLYYVLAGTYWRVAQWLRLEGGGLLYGVRFLNLLLVAGLVWLGYTAAQTLFPERPFVRLGVPALLAFLPQSAFYSIENDVLSPLSFGASYICLLRWLRGDAPSVRLSAVTGLAFAATFLTKLSNLPFLTVSLAAFCLIAWRLAKTGKLRTALPALTILVLSAGLPTALWLAWTRYHFGDFTGTPEKIKMLGWTDKPINEWSRHPIFTPAGFSSFISPLLSSFWQGELIWHGQRLASSVAGLIYTGLSLVFIGFASSALLPKISHLSLGQRNGVWLSLWLLLAGVFFLGFLSIIFDFHDCLNPSRSYPYFTSGRLLLGAAVPFFLLLVFGLDRGLDKIPSSLAKPVALGGLILFMLVMELATTWPVFSSRFNWFHI